MSVRKRVPQFTYNEKYNLVDIVEKNFGIVECKKTDGQSSKNKAAKWDEIAKEFNATSQHLFREQKVLKGLWENLKKNAKNIITSEKQNTFGTGGGPAKITKHDPILERVISMVRAQSEGFSNPYDGDYLQNEELLFERHEDENLSSGSLEQNTIDVCSETVVQNQNWSSFTPKMLKQPISIILRNDGIVDNQSEIIIDHQHEVENVVAVLPTPPKPREKTKLAASRRRPKIGGDLLAQKKFDALELSCEEATAEHKLKLKILELNVEQEQEKLKQEKEKTAQQEIQTAILRKQLHNLL